ncbi:MAG TPA: hypothetical protein VNG71_04465 [Pyrinomonadaceae bacterium]|nr:hypothetical protein [Pyrinomonadaceae bacterium]
MVDEILVLDNTPMTQGTLFEQQAPARCTDPETAHEAAAANQLSRFTMRREVLLLLQSKGSKGATDWEISEELGILRTSAGKRRHELVALGLVENSGQRRETDTGSTAIVWRAK